MLKDFNVYHHNDDKTGVAMVEYHTDTCKEFQKMASEDDNCHFDAYASVRRDSQKKMIIVFGNDECIFKDNAYSSMTWIGPNGEKPMMPKYEFPGIMISAFQSREFGFGFHELTDDNSKRVNDYRNLQQN